MNTFSKIKNALEMSPVNVGDKERIASVTSGAALLASGVTEFKRKRVSSIVKGLIGGFMVYRGLTGQCPIRKAAKMSAFDNGFLEISEHIYVKVQRKDVYNIWRKLENLPRFMKHLKSVTQLDSRRSYWEARIPGGIGKLSWEAEILLEQPGEVISWRSIKDSSIDNSGQVFFRDAADGLGTEIKATIAYYPPAGEAGKAVAKLLNHTFGNMIREDLLRFKEMLEGGELEANMLKKTDVI